MSARDTFHQTVKIALEKDRWLITHDPYPLQAGSFNLAIDLGAETVIAAEREGRKIAVEIKSFLGPSKISQFYSALGQFITYRTALEKQEKERNLYLAVSTDIYEKFLLTPFIQKLISENKIYLIIFQIQEEEIERWLP
ncbi:MAG: XisH family protein [Prochloron sp. SP5CPC1]|nr:XisH family protein [Candidatus Paraprochloron terpiosi SP5CPC1]